MFWPRRLGDFARGRARPVPRLCVWCVGWSREPAIREGRRHQGAVSRNYEIPPSRYVTCRRLGASPSADCRARRAPGGCWHRYGEWVILSSVGWWYGLTDCSAGEGLSCCRRLLHVVLLPRCGSGAAARGCSAAASGAFRESFVFTELTRPHAGQGFCYNARRASRRPVPSTLAWLCFRYKDRRLRRSRREILAACSTARAAFLSARDRVIPLPPPTAAPLHRRRAATAAQQADLV